IHYINLVTNRGLGFALNKGFEAASALGVEYVATFDQDSAVLEGLIGGLHRTFLKLQSTVPHCAAVAPVFFDRRAGSKIRFPFYREVNGRIQAVSAVNKTETVVEVDVLITSGMLVKVSVWEQGV